MTKQDRCFLCAVPFKKIEWLKEGRALYCNYNDPTQFRISGVGNFSASDLFPVNPDSTYFHSNDELIFVDTGRMGYARGPVIPEEPTYYGFVFHPSCWLLLSKAVSLKDEEISALGRICQSCPRQGGILYFGHNFAGALSYSCDPSVLPLGQEQSLSGRFAKHWFSYRHGSQYRDPLILPNPDLLTFLGQSRMRLHSPQALSYPESPDCFTELPPEIRQMILEILPSPDVRRLKLASRIFAGTYLPTSFWRSRFETGFEYHAYYEAKASSNPNWEAIYFGLKDFTDKHDKAFENRFRIWDNIQRLLPLLKLRSPEGESFQSVFEPNAPTDRIKRSKRSANVWKSGHFDSGCIELWKRTLCLKRDIIRVEVWFTFFGDLRYISGLEFFFSNGLSMPLGFLHAELSHSTIHVQNPISLDFAVDGHGVRAVHLGSATPTGWAGDSINVPRMIYPFKNAETICLKTGFDAFKMVSIALNPYHLWDGIRERALWIPDVPPIDWYLNERSFFDDERGLDGYKPLTVFHFGGPRGTHLPKILRISAWIDRFGRVLALKVIYAQPINGKTDLFLGPEKIFEGGHEDGSVETFEIDGPNGELITSVCLIEKAYSVPHLGLTAFSIQTNRRRKAQFPSSLTNANKSESVKVEPDTVITGFYAALAKMDGIRRLGVISERFPAGNE